MKTKESFTINGEYLEDLVDGYITLRTMGREVLAKEIETITTKRDGATIKNTRFPARTIKIYFHLKGDSLPDLRDKLIALNKHLNIREARITFDDEPDVFYIGTPITDSDLNDALDSAYGTYSIVCYDPYKYSLTETVVDGVMSEGASVITATNNGSAKAFPKFEVQFADDTSSSGVIGDSADCGYVMMSKYGTDYSLQFGDPLEKDSGTTTPISTDFRKATKGNPWDDDTTLNLPSWSYLATKGTGAMTYVADGGGARVSSYGTTQSGKFFGALHTAPISSAVSGEFEFSWKQIFALHQTATTGRGQMGICLIVFYDEDGQVVYSYGVKKANTTTLNGEAIAFDSDGIKTLKNNVNLSWTGALGYANTGYSARYSTQTIRRVQKDDGLWYIDINSAVGNFTLGGYETAPPIKTVGFFLGRYGTYAVPTVNVFTSAQLIGGEVDLINTFGANDFLEVDVASMDVLLNSKPSTGLGDVSNSWSNMAMEEGSNTYVCQWSDWVPSGKEPTFRMRFRKRWL